MSKYARVVVVIVAFFFLNILIWGRSLFNLVLNGDDIILIGDSIKHFNDFFAKLTAFSGQYRPLSKILFIIYYPFRYNFHVLYAVHLFVFTLVQSLFFITIRNKLNTISSFVLSVFVFYNPIFYYHIFAIAGDINLSIIALLLISVNLLWQKKYLWTVVVFLVAILIKETFIVLLPLVLYSVYKSKLKANNKILLILALIFVISTYFFARFSNYTPLDNDYRFVFSLTKAKENIGNMLAWMINHPRGAEFGFYGFRNMFNYILSGTIATFGLVAILTSFKENKLWSITLFMVAVFSVVPFVFLNRTLFFYTDILFVIFGLLLVPLLGKLKTKLLSVALVVVVILAGMIFFDKWIKYSFVANSNSIAKNYIITFKQVVKDPKSDVCIIDHNLGSWPTINGSLGYFIRKDFAGKITSTTDNKPEYCGNGSIIIKNNGSEYALYAQP